MTPTARAIDTAEPPLILVVDDAFDSRSLFTELLQLQGYRVVATDSGERGLEVAENSQPDLILMDVVMPGIGGFEACRRLKANASTAHIPVVFLSGRNETDDVVAGFDIGASDYISKPPRSAELCARVKAHLQTIRSTHALQREALADPLTRLPNRRHFDSFLEREWQRALRNGTPLSLLVLDVDHFKLCNDTLGHAAGDTCLQRVAQVLQSHALRPTDLAARYGGEEFVLLLAETPAEAAATIAGKIRAEVEALHLPNPQSPACAWLTVSIGVATMVPGPRDAIGELFAAADSQMYAAKRAGRNRVAATRGDAPITIPQAQMLH